MREYVFGKTQICIRISTVLEMQFMEAIKGWKIQFEVHHRKRTIACSNIEKTVLLRNNNTCTKHLRNIAESRCKIHTLVFPFYRSL